MSYAWAFGDGETGSGSLASHPYPDAGLYTVVVTASNGVSLTTGTTLVTVPPVVGFTAAPRQGVAPLAVQFTDTSSSGVDQWYWTFGDGGTSAVRHPVYTYTQAGIYTVTQQVTETISEGWRDKVFLRPHREPVEIPRYHADKNIYLEPNVSEISVPGVNHTGYFQNAVVANWVYLILGGEWSSFPDPGGLPDWEKSISP